jgi:membrane protease YdiL (CAAX protease family)
VQNTFQDRHGPWRAVLLTTPWFLLEHAFFAAEGTWQDGLVWAAVFLVAAVPVRAMLGWIYNRTGSIFMVGLTHAATNAIGVSLMPVLFGASGSTGLALVVPGILVLILTSGRLGLPKT